MARRSRDIVAKQISWRQEASPGLGQYFRVYSSFFTQRHGSGDDPRAVRITIVASGSHRIATTCGSYPATDCSPGISLFWGCFGVCRRWKSKNRCKNRIFGLVEPVFPIIGPYIHIFAVAEARSGPPCDLVRILGVAVAVGNLPSLFIIVSFGERQRSGPTHGHTIDDCSEESPSLFGNLWVVPSNALFCIHFFGSSHVPVNIVRPMIRPNPIFL